MLICLLIPHYDHLTQFQKFLPQLARQGIPLVVVDDASPEPVYSKLSEILKEHSPDSILVRHAENQGKGVAVLTGFKVALEAGYTHAIQIDADGQHDVSSIARLIEGVHQYPDRIICGQPVFDTSVSSLRFYARYITLYFVWLETLSFEIRDAMCGFRSYPLNSTIALAEKSMPGNRMTFDPEILVRAVWAGISLHFSPVYIVYPDDGKSHFRYLRDNLEISWMHARLVCGMFLRFPRLMRRKFLKQTGRDAR